jgi:class 3 adenylate cyclase/tetratricopeptide (TPR) repeat protein
MVICPGCGEENPERFRLCGFCGTPLGPALLPREVRKTVTIVFSDLKGSTAIGERLDSESLRELMTRYFEEMRAILERHGGRVEKYIGDAIMAVFGLPRLHEDDALRGVRAAVEMRDELHRLNDRLEQTWGVRLTTRTGVNTGEVVSGDPATGQGLVIGDPVNVAARLEQAAPAMEVLIGQPTYRLVRDAVVVEEVEPLPLKGKSEPVPAYRLISVSDSEGVARRLDSVLVGRTEELGVLEDAFATAVCERRCVLTAVLGDAGLGKTRITAELARRLDGQARVVRGRCLPYGQGITFWPVVEAVRDAAGIRDGDDLGAARTKLSRMLEDPPAADRVASAVGLSQEQYPVEELFWGVRKLVDVLADERPLVVIFDDLHWAEETFLDLVEHLVETVDGVPFLLVACSRPDLLDRRPEFAKPPGRRLALGRLSEADAEQVVEAVLGGGSVASHVARQIITAAEGNALFLEQLVAMLVDEGQVRLEEGIWTATQALDGLAAPPTIQALMATRLDGLSDEQRTVIEAASVAGQTFPLDAVEELVPEVLRERVREHLGVLISKRLAEPVEGADHEHARFGHIMIRDAAYGGLLKRARATLHEKFVDWADRTSSDRDVEYEEIRGWHLEQAYYYLCELGPLDMHGIAVGVRASQRLASAGRRAFGRGDMPAAVGLFRRAASLVPELSPHRLTLFPDLGEALMDLGEFEEAERVVAEAIEAADLIRDPRLLAEARLVRLLVHRYSADPRGWAEEVEEEAARAIPLFRAADDHGALCRAWRLLVYVHATASRAAEAAAAATQVIEQAALAGDRRRQGLGATTYATASLYGSTPVKEAISECERILDPGLGDLQAEGQVLSALAYLYAMDGDASRARECHARALAVLEDHGRTVLAAAAAVESWGVLMLAGDPAAAESRLRHDYGVLERMGEKLYLPTVAALLGQAIYAQGRYADAGDLAEVARAQAPEDDVDAQALWRSLLAKVLARAGRAAEAERFAQEAVETLHGSDALVMQADALADLAEVLRLAGRVDEAHAALGEAAALYERKGNRVSAARVMLLLEEVGSTPTP